ncbi:hypothetical protein MCOR19_011641 [Pyricularia oryzae]|nr:hypothetical protein MCOR19_011641 [Pyricularia oryzae]KAI6459686.1 hypothetical protein MCOR18_011379 [Pyricularia oryzae]KAI6507504.1 hypothetical protein MCOR16_011811 [Pyricularia oryzae]KAI6517666.1 hypothetical protein MCOR05_011478 [Pyricularia oryzae]KAI6550468.1 hypothetical protein MCOR09_011328 [Pyricularia oryzae]
MKASVSSVLLAALAGSAVAEKINTSQFNAQFLQAHTAPHAVEMSVLREKKVTQHEKDVAAGRFDVDRYQATGATPCVDGKAGEYQCSGLDLMGFLRHQDMGSRTRVGNDVWGK